MNFAFKHKSFTRDQLIFVVEVMVASTVEFIECAFPGRWIGNEHRKQQTLRNWVRENDLPSIKIRQNTSYFAIWQLGWNLSILYAQLTGGGIAEFEALHCMGFQQPLEEWADKWVNGEIGIIPTGANSGIEIGPALDIAAGVDKLFEDYFKEQNEQHSD